MNCFNWQSRLSDFVDGTLIGQMKIDADRHLDQCKDCQEKFQHYRLILESISAQPRLTVPLALRKNPLAKSLSNADGNQRLPAPMRFGIARFWRGLPTAARTSLEGAAIALAILGSFTLIPRFRGLYERNLERRLEAVNMEELTLKDHQGEEGEENADAAEKQRLARGRVLFDETAPVADLEDDFEGDAEPAAPPPNGKVDAVKVGQSEVWRFSLRTDSPHEIRPKIVQVLQTLGISRDTPGLGGIEAPGGIQFDLLVPQTVIPQLKSQLEKLTPLATTDGAQTDSEEPTEQEPGARMPNGPFTWYKNKSKRVLPSGKSRVVIWLSLI